MGCGSSLPVPGGGWGRIAGPTRPHVSLSAAAPACARSYHNIFYMMRLMRAAGAGDPRTLHLITSTAAAPS